MIATLMNSCESTLHQLWAWRHSRHPIAYERGWYNGFTKCRCVCQPLSAESVVLCVTQCIALVQDSTIVVEVVYSNSMLCDVIMLLLRVCWVKSLSDFRLIYFLGQINFFWIYIEVPCFINNCVLVLHPIFGSKIAFIFFLRLGFFLWVLIPVQ